MFSQSDVIYSYSRADAIDDGVLVNVKPELQELKCKLLGWPTICFTQSLFEDLVKTPAYVTVKQKEKYNHGMIKVSREEYLKRFEKLRLKKVWDRFIDMLLLHFDKRKSGEWSFKYHDLSLTNPTVVKVLIHRDDNHNEVVTLMKEWED